MKTKRYIMLPNYIVIDVLTGIKYKATWVIGSGFQLTSSIWLEWDKCIRILSENELGYILYGDRSERK